MDPALQTWLTERPDLSRIGRADLYRLFEGLGLDRGAEIGVEGGGNAAAMLAANPRLHLLGVDAWTPYREYGDYRRPSRLQGFYEQAQQHTAPYADRCRLVRAFSMDAVRDVPTESLDFCYIDGNHEFDYVMQDLIEWSKRVAPGGIVAGHDYHRLPKRRVQVIEAVTAYRQAHGIEEFWVFGGQCPTEHDIPPSWFWVKP